MWSRYSTDDINLAFRKAAAAGEPQDIVFMRQHLARVHIDARGQGSQMTALHQACKNGSVAAAGFLLAHNANPDLIDKSGKDAYQYAADSGNAELIETLRLCRLGRKAWNIAHELFPVEPTEATLAEFHRTVKQLSQEVASEESAFKEQVISRVMKYRDEKQAEKLGAVFLSEELAESRFLPALNNFLKYIHNLAGIYHIFSVTSARNFKAGYCDAIAASVFCALVDENCVMERVLLYNQVIKGNHAFIILNRAPESDITDPDTWGKSACFINDNGEVYPVAHRAADSVLKMLRLIKEGIYKVTTYSVVPPSLDDLIYADVKDFARQQGAEWIEKLRNLPAGTKMRAAPAAPIAPNPGQIKLHP